MVHQVVSNPATVWGIGPLFAAITGRHLLTLLRLPERIHICFRSRLAWSLGLVTWPGRLAWTFCHIILTPSFLRTGVAFKEGMCYGKAEAAALFFVTPTLLLVPELLPAHPRCDETKWNVQLRRVGIFTHT